MSSPEYLFAGAMFRVGMVGAVAAERAEEASDPAAVWRRDEGITRHHTMGGGGEGGGWVSA